MPETTFTMEINCSNAAFDNPDELPRLIHSVADRIAAYNTTGAYIIDANGNNVGRYDFLDAEA